MPSRLINGYKFQFYSLDEYEPPHIHIVKAEKRAKIWLYDLSVAYNRGFNNRELNKIMNITQEHQQEFTEWYNEFFA